MEKDRVLDNGKRSAGVKDLDADLAAAFSKTSAIALAILDDQRRYQFVNNALVAMHDGVPAEAFVGSTLRDIIGDAAPEAEARLQRVSVAGETPFLEVVVKLPARTEPGYWIEKDFPIHGRSGRVIQIASLAVEVTAQRKLENCFRKLGGELLWKNEEYQRLARELHDSIHAYHAALGMNLDNLSRCTRKPEKISELLARPSEFLDEAMRKLTSIVARCFPIHQQQ
jgi:signal transduction histidine kinase